MNDVLETYFLLSSTSQITIITYHENKQTYKYTHLFARFPIHKLSMSDGLKGNVNWQQIHATREKYVYDMLNDMGPL